jgi:hypothetical protein
MALVFLSSRPTSSLGTPGRLKPSRSGPEPTSRPVPSQPRVRSPRNLARRRLATSRIVASRPVASQYSRPVASQPRAPSPRNLASRRLAARASGASRLARRRLRVARQVVRLACRSPALAWPGSGRVPPSAVRRRHFRRRPGAAISGDALAPRSNAAPTHAPERTRTSTDHSVHKALNLARLPIPPQARAAPV